MNTMKSSSAKGGSPHKTAASGQVLTEYLLALIAVVLAAAAALALVGYFFGYGGWLFGVLDAGFP